MKFTKPACKTCPFRTDGDQSVAFEPETLKKNVVPYTEDERVHPCHSNQEYACAGQISYWKAKGVLFQQRMIQVACRLGLTSEEELESVPTVPVFDSIPAMLRSHGLRLWYPGEIHRRGGR